MSVKPKPAPTPTAYSAVNLLHCAIIIHNEEVAAVARHEWWRITYVGRRILSQTEMEAIGGLVFMELRMICEEHKT